MPADQCAAAGKVAPVPLHAENATVQAAVVQSLAESIERNAAGIRNCESKVRRPRARTELRRRRRCDPRRPPARPPARPARPPTRRVRRPQVNSGGILMSWVDEWWKGRRG